MRVTYVILEILFCLIISYPAYPKSNKDQSFDQAVQALIKEKPQMAIQASSIKEKPVVWYTYDELRRCVDASAAMYLLWRVGNIYYYTYYASALVVQEGSIWKGIKSFGKTYIPSLANVRVIPRSLSSLITYFGFTRAVALVALEVIIYKTVAKLILYCCYADFFEIVEQGAIRLKRLITALFFL